MNVARPMIGQLSLLLAVATGFALSAAALQSQLARRVRIPVRSTRQPRVISSGFDAR